MSADTADLRRLEQAIARLPAPERAILLLCARDNLSLADAAARLGATEDAARCRLADALYQLDRALEPPRRPWWRLW